MSVWLQLKNLSFPSRSRRCPLPAAFKSSTRTINMTGRVNCACACAMQRVSAMRVRLCLCVCACAFLCLCVCACAFVFVRVCVLERHCPRHVPSLTSAAIQAVRLHVALSSVPAAASELHNVSNNIKQSSPLIYCAFTFSLSSTSAACCLTEAPACAACSTVIFSLYLLPLLHFASRTSHTPLPHFLSCNFCFSIISIAVSSWLFNLR